MSDSINKIIEARIRKQQDKYYYVDNEEDVRVSTGSLKFDYVIGGGFEPGIIRFAGCSEAGKTSEAFELARNCIRKYPNTKVLYFKTEGRVPKYLWQDKEIKLQKYVKDWDVGTSLLMPVNDYNEFIYNVTQCLYSTPRDYKDPNYIRYFFIVDSLDCLNTTVEKQNGEEITLRVGGNTGLTTHFFANYNLPIVSLGHYLVAVSQVRANITGATKKWKDTSDQKKANMSGGHAAIHLSNWILEFRERNKGDLILDNKNDKPDFNSNRIIGENVKVDIKKSTNKTTFYQVSYAIKRNSNGPDTIWVEKEVFDLMLGFGLLTNKSEDGKISTWYKLTPWAKAEYENNFIKEPSKVSFQGEGKFLTYLDENPQDLKFWVGFIKDLITQDTKSSKPVDSF